MVPQLHRAWSRPWSPRWSRRTASAFLVRALPRWRQTHFPSMAAGARIGQLHAQPRMIGDGGSGHRWHRPPHCRRCRRPPPLRHVAHQADSDDHARRFQEHGRLLRVRTCPEGTRTRADDPGETISSVSRPNRGVRNHEHQNTWNAGPREPSRGWGFDDQSFPRCPTAGVRAQWHGLS